MTSSLRRVREVENYLTWFVNSKGGRGIYTTDREERIVECKHVVGKDTTFEGQHRIH